MFCYAEPFTRRFFYHRSALYEKLDEDYMMGDREWGPMMKIAGLKCLWSPILFLRSKIQHNTSSSTLGPSLSLYNFRNNRHDHRNDPSQNEGKHRVQTCHRHTRQASEYSTGRSKRTESNGLKSSGGGSYEWWLIVSHLQLNTEKQGETNQQQSQKLRIQDQKGFPEQRRR